MKFSCVEGTIAGVDVTDMIPVRYALSLADSAMLTQGGAPFSPWPGARARQRVIEALKSMAPIEIESMLVAKSWLAANARNLLVVEFKLDKRMRSFIETNMLWRRSCGKWEDLALLSRGKLVMWSCTHDQDLIVSASESRLQSLGYKPRPAERISVEVEPVAEEAVELMKQSIREYVANGLR